MAFIQMYAAWEFTVKNSVREALEMVCSHGLEYRELRLELTGLLMQADLESVASTAKDKFWQKAMELLARTGCSDRPSAMPNTFPADGSQYRLSQIYVIWGLFGITEPVVPDARLTQLIREVVDHRNAVAHGRETPENVGRRFSKGDILGKIDGVRDIAVHVASTLELHCGVPDKLKR